ncbi:uncharacterized protein [Chelonus insularis]|uniref:uncharacterized protein n=1 Tax=Chelonus insularis TaxID=460826 RepID=UPI00158BDED3|nr:uncharacterized protein LOC118064060 [Chelonus insularis]XP_034934327.1 uncharacterized protein LOC118064060 [Chelonus insularis]
MTTLKGIFPDPKPPRKKNYLQENVKHLRQMEKYNQSQKEEKEIQKLMNQKQFNNKYQNIAPRVNSSLRGLSAISGENISRNKSRASSQSLDKKSSAPIFSKETVINKKNLSKSQTNSNVNSKKKKRDRHKQNLEKSNSLSDGFLHLKLNNDSPLYSSRKTKYSNQSIQTLNTDEIDALYSEGVIRYPSGRSQRKSPDPSPDKNKDLDLQLPLNIGDQSTTVSEKKIESSSSKENKDFVKLNKEKTSIATKIAAHFNNGVIPTNYRMGVVPKYILERKEELQQKLEKAKLEAIKTDCPPGHIILPDNERKETLRMLKKSYQDYVNELNKMPIRSDTLRCQKKKAEIEKQLNKLEEGIKLFSRPKVFVKIDE